MLGGAEKVGARVSIMVGFLLAALVAPASEPCPSSPRPSLPYESHGACPFECCTYRTWTVKADTNILAERKDGAAVAFRVASGDRVEGLTGVVVTIRLGRATVRHDTTIGEGSDALPVASGEAVHVLHYVGEGYWKVWVRGRAIDTQLADKDTGCPDDRAGPVECAVRITKHPHAVWWARIRSGGREGWTRQLELFGNIDACGSREIASPPNKALQRTGDGRAGARS
jgi:hypothetical protein